LRKYNLKFNFFLIIAIVLISTLLLVACGEKAASPATTSPAPAQTQAAASDAVFVKEWFLPTLAVQTGPIAFAGLPYHWGADYAVAEINAAGGIRGVPLKTTHYDSAFPDTAKTAAAAAKAIPGALLLNGPMIYPEVAAISQLIMDAKIGSLNAADDPTFLEPIKPYGIAHLPSFPKGHVNCGLKWLQLNPDIKTVACIYDATQPELVQTVGEMTAAYGKVGVTVVPCETVGADQFDFSATVLKALQAKANGFHSLLLDAQTASLAKELYNRGVTNSSKLICGYAANGPSLFTTGKGFMEGSYVWDNMNVLSTDPKYKSFEAAFIKQFNTPMVSSAACSMDAVYAFKVAVETLKITGDPAKLATERQKIVDFLYNAKGLPGTAGLYTYNYENGVKKCPRTLMQIKDNKLTYVAEIQ
jgi:branched-chain amino acid transport system substrate-binding protein